MASFCESPAVATLEPQLFTAAVIEMIEARDSAKSNCIGSILDLNNQSEVEELIKDPLIKMKKVRTLS